MEEKSGAFAEKKRRGGKRLMKPEKAPKERRERAEKEPRVPRETSGKKPGKVIGIVVLVFALAYLGLCAWAKVDDKIAPNTYFAGVNYGGMTPAQAKSELQSRLDRAQGATVSFALPDGTPVTDLALGTIDVSADVEDIAGTIGAKNYHGFLMGGVYYAKTLFSGGAEIEDVSYDGDFAAAAQTVRAAIDCDPVEFAINVTEDGQVSIRKPMDGRRAVTADGEDPVVALLRNAYFSGGEPSEITLEPVDGENGGVYEVVSAEPVDLAAQREAVVGQKVNASYDKVNGTILPGHAGVDFSLADLQSAYDAAAPGETVSLANATVEAPDVTAEQLEKVLFRDVLSTYTTKVGGAEGRRANVKLTASRINGYIMNAGETMKYGPLVTPFTAANGYSAAPGYLQGKTVDMVGGGACQASSTLYAAALYANLEIVQRTNHGFASDYIGLGLDATVAEGGPEFEFRNNTNYPIKVVAEYYASGGKNYIKITLRGTKVDDSYVKIKTDVLETIPFEEEIVETDELAPGERKVEQTAYTGYKVKTYRNVYSGDGKLISSTFEASSNYKARNRIVLVGKSTTTTPTDPGTTTPTDPGTTTPTDPGTTTPTDPGTTDPGTGDGGTSEPPEQMEKPGWLDTP